MNDISYKNNMAHKILIVDDEPNILMSLEFLMKKNGFEVFIARNGTEALEIIAAQLPQLILLDIMMPDVDGYEVCRQVKENELTKHIHIIFLSAKGKEVDINKGLSLGASLYVTKPFSTRTLLVEINKLLEG